MAPCLLLLLTSLPAARAFSAAGLGQLDARRTGAGLAANPVRMCAAGDRDLLIVGAGTLGSLIVKQHRAAFPTARIVAETRSVSQRLLLCLMLLPALARTLPVAAANALILVHNATNAPHRSQ